MTIKPPPSKRVSARKNTPPKSHGQKTLRAVKVGATTATIAAMEHEIEDMKDVLLGRVPPPINHGLLTLFEVADAYFARASEMAMTILRMEREGRVTKGSNAQKFRTQELRLFMEISKRAADLGSRRVTFEGLRIEAERTGRSNYFEDLQAGDGDD